LFATLFGPLGASLQLLNNIFLMMAIPLMNGFMVNAKLSSVGDWIARLTSAFISPVLVLQELNYHKII
jgi:hypothetical protein